METHKKISLKIGQDCKLSSFSLFFFGYVVDFFLILETPQAFGVGIFGTIKQNMEFHEKKIKNIYMYCM